MSEIFGIEKSVLEIVLRGTVIYLGLLVLARFFLRRQSGTGSLSDILVVVLLADASQNGMAGEYRTVTEGLILISTILVWTFVIDWLSYQVKWLEKLTHPASIIVVSDGKPLRRNMRRELLTYEELMSQIRIEGVEKIEDVKEARVEGDGSLSVIKR